MPGRGRVDRGLGSVDVATLAQARAWALDNKLAVKRGEDPFAGPQRSTACLRFQMSAGTIDTSDICTWAEVDDHSTVHPNIQS